MSAILGIIALIILLIVFGSKTEPTKQYGVTAYTQKGESVRSYADKKLADVHKRWRDAYSLSILCLRI